MFNKDDVVIITDKKQYLPHHLRHYINTRAKIIYGPDERHYRVICYFDNGIKTFHQDYLEKEETQMSTRKCFEIDFHNADMGRLAQLTAFNYGYTIGGGTTPMYLNRTRFQFWSTGEITYGAVNESLGSLHLPDEWDKFLEYLKEFPKEPTNTFANMNFKVQDEFVDFGDAEYTIDDIKALYRVTQKAFEDAYEVAVSGSFDNSEEFEITWGCKTFSLADLEKLVEKLDANG